MKKRNKTLFTFVTISIKSGFKYCSGASQTEEWENPTSSSLDFYSSFGSWDHVLPDVWPQHSLCNPFPQLTAGGVRVGSENDQAALGVVHGARFPASALLTLRQWIPGYPRCTEPFLQFRGVGAQITSFEIQNKTHLWTHYYRMRRCTCAVDWFTVYQSVNKLISWMHP